MRTGQPCHAQRSNRKHIKIAPANIASLFLRTLYKMHSCEHCSSEDYYLILNNTFHNLLNTL